MPEQATHVLPSSARQRADHHNHQTRSIKHPNASSNISYVRRLRSGSNLSMSPDSLIDMMKNDVFVQVGSPEVMANSIVKMQYLSQGACIEKTLIVNEDYEPEVFIDLLEAMFAGIIHGPCWERAFVFCENEDLRDAALIMLTKGFGECCNAVKVDPATTGLVAASSPLSPERMVYGLH